MLSRVAESLYWMARYLERAENTARLINSTTQTILDLPRRASFGWDGLLRIAGLDNLYSEHYGQPNEDDIMQPADEMRDTLLAGMREYLLAYRDRLSGRQAGTAAMQKRPAAAA